MFARYISSKVPALRTALRQTICSDAHNPDNALQFTRLQRVDRCVKAFRFRWLCSEPGLPCFSWYLFAAAAQATGASSQEIDLSWEYDTHAAVLPVPAVMYILTLAFLSLCHRNQYAVAAN